ncbi:MULTISPECIES: tetratricopeptide repeat protein [Pseudoxanthomonas]|uniref:Tetratricopeptide repeat protein n=1 Tax=Pseudoxanthomonas taiwanensis J19 TaxID=935569 RepID=A0A562DHH4_9GAMM|nr:MULTISPECIES: tetratricopeptide repeat protein [Pseudoxanthomonas]TWH09023.1 tetratricopeptide repeat protein [Pseudoxanthomonas taiwanensis J19]
MYALALAAALAASPAAEPPAEPVAALPPPPTLPTVQAVQHIPGIDEVLEIPPDLRAMLQERVIARGGSREDRIERLAAMVLEVGGLALEYDNDRTRTVAETWRDRRANCLSFTLVFVALARAAGLEARVQEVGEVLAWYRDAGVIYGASHVNAGVRAGLRRYTLDVERNILAMRDRPRAIDDIRALAHFRNNRGAELMAAGDLEGARAQLEAALEADPEFVPALNNLGVLEQRAGNLDASAAALRAAWRLQPAHTATLSNLVNLYQRSGQAELAADFVARLEQVRRSDPFAQFVLALGCEEAGNYACAVTHYRNAIRLHGGQHAFHFGLARAYFLSGHPDLARREMARAAKLGDTDRVRAMYRRKLEHLEHWPGNGHALHAR